MRSSCVRVRPHRCRRHRHAHARPYLRLAAAHVGRRVNAICRVQRDGAHAQPSRRYGRCMAHGPHGLPHAHRLPHAQGIGAWELCAAFAIGGTNSDNCAQNYSRLKTEEACASLGAIAGVSTYAGSDEYSYYPVGCFRHTISGKFYWNTHDRGANNSFAQPLCAGAPHRRHMRHACRCKVQVIGYAHMPHHVVLNHSVLRRCLGTHYPGGTRVLGAQPAVTNSKFN